MRWLFRSRKAIPPVTTAESRPAQRAWAWLPTLRPAVPPLRQATPTRSFVRSLSSRQLPPLALAPLGHSVHPGAAAGLVSGVATPIALGARQSGRRRSQTTGSALSLPLFVASAPYRRRAARSRRPPQRTVNLLQPVAEPRVEPSNVASQPPSVAAIVPPTPTDAVQTRGGGWEELEAGSDMGNLPPARLPLTPTFPTVPTAAPDSALRVPRESGEEKGAARVYPDPRGRAAPRGPAAPRSPAVDAPEGAAPGRPHKPRASSPSVATAASRWTSPAPPPAVEGLPPAAASAGAPPARAAADGRDQPAPGAPSPQQDASPRHAPAEQPVPADIPDGVPPRPPAGANQTQVGLGPPLARRPPVRPKRRPPAEWVRTDAAAAQEELPSVARSAPRPREQAPIMRVHAPARSGRLPERPARSLVALAAPPSLPPAALPARKGRATEDRPADALPLRPLLAARGLHVQRSSEPVPTAMRASLEPQLQLDLSEVRVHRGEDSARLAVELDARAFTAGGEVHVPASHGSLESGPGRALLAHELVHVAQQRRIGPNLPAEDSPLGRELETQARLVEQSWSSSISHRAATAPRRARAAATRSQPAAAEPTQRAAGTAPAAPPPPSPSGPAAPAAEPGRSAAATSPPPPSAAPPAAPQETASSDVQQLADRVYERVRTLLRTELLVDRERSGFVTDVR